MNAKELVREAATLADGGKPDEAMELVNKVLMDEPDNCGALYVAGCVMLEAARHVQGIQVAKRIAELKPASAKEVVPALHRTRAAAAPPKRLSRP